MKRFVLCLLLSIGALLPLRSSGLSQAEVAVTPQAVVARSLPQLQSLGVKFIENTGCVSCHNNSLPAMAISLARERGFKIDEQAVQLENSKISELWGARRERFLQGVRPAGGSDTLAYVLVGLAASGQMANATTDAAVHFLAGHQTETGHWDVDNRIRPPLEASYFNTAALSIRALQLYAPEGRSASINKQIAEARKWLIKTVPRSNEDRIFQLFGLRWSGADNAATKKAVTQLLALQLSDGGWAQLPGMQSDAYATGQALVALQRAGGLPVSAPAYKRGVQYLLSNAKPDGTWHVQTRVLPLQKYIESGFPYGKDQFISAAATSWAVMALALTIDPIPGKGITRTW